MKNEKHEKIRSIMYGSSYGNEPFRRLRQQLFRSA